jgi:hypothetical protein
MCEPQVEFVYAQLMGVLNGWSVFDKGRTEIGTGKETGPRRTHHPKRPPKSRLRAPQGGPPPSCYRRPLVEDGYAVRTGALLLSGVGSRRCDLPTEVLSFSGVSHSWRIAPITWCIVRHCRASGLDPTTGHHSHRED